MCVDDDGAFVDCPDDETRDVVNNNIVNNDDDGGTISAEDSLVAEMRDMMTRLQTHLEAATRESVRAQDTSAEKSSDELSAPDSSDKNILTRPPFTRLNNSLLDSVCALPNRANINAIAINRVPESGTQLSFSNNAFAEFCGTQIGIVNTRHKESRGMQSGVMNISRGYLDGMQAGYWMNIASDTVSHLQAGAFNFGRVVGYVQAGAFNISNHVGYVQAGAGNIGGDIGFVQGGAYNIARDVGSFQGGAVNIARDVGVVQGGSLNIARDIGAVQGGAVNISRSVGTVQLGAMNITGKTPLQIGALNITGTAGRQIGAVNIAGYSEKTPIGALNIVGNGIIDYTVYADAAGDLTFSLRTGMPWLYTLLEHNHNEQNSVGSSDAIGWGLGTRFGMNGPFTINLDALTLNTHTWNCWQDKDCRDYYSNLHNPNNRGSRNSSRIVNFDNGVNRASSDGDDGDDDDNRYRAYWSHQIHRLRLGASYNPIPFVALTAGVSLSMNVERPGVEDSTWRMPERRGSVYSGEFMNGRRIHAWPGVYAGVTVGKVRSHTRAASREGREASD